MKEVSFPSLHLVNLYLPICKVLIYAPILIIFSCLTEGLFNLIINQNLDYPKFFESLYKLCTPTIFSAKYRSKFLSLLSKSLKSTNLPAHFAAAFAKRFATLAVSGPTPTAAFCLAQVAALLKTHPQVQSHLYS